MSTDGHAEKLVDDIIRGLWASH